MARDGSFLVRILGDVDDLRKKLKDGGDSVEDFGSRTSSSLKGGVDDAIKGVTGRFGALGDAAGQSLSGISSKAIDAGGAIGTGIAGGALAAGAGIAVLAAKGVSSFVDLAGKIRDVQRVSGATAEESSKLVAVMDDMGINADKGAGAIFKLSRNIEGNEDALRKNGIEVAKNKDGSTDLINTLLNVADAYKKAGGGAAGNKVAFDAFGKSGAALIPILEQGRGAIQAMFEEADKHGEVLNQEDLTSAREYELAMDDLGDAVGGLERSLGEGLVPVISDFATQMASAIDALNNMTAPIGGVKGLIEGLASAIPGIGDLKRNFEIWGDQTDENVDSVKEVARATAEQQKAAGDLGDETELLTEEIKEQNTALAAAEDALRKVTEATLGSFDADIRYKESVNAVEDALKAMEEKQKAATEAKGLDAVKNEEYDRSLLDVEQAVLRQAVAFADSTAKQAEMAGTTVNATEKAALQRDELQRVADKLAPGSALRTQLEGYITKLNDIPGVKTTVVNADTIKAKADIESIANALSRVPRSVAIEMAIDARQRDTALINRFRASGGPVAPGVDYLVGEHGPEVFRSADPGRIDTRFSTAGTAAAVVENHFHLDNVGFIGSQREFEDLIVRSVTNVARRNGSAFAGLG